MAFSELSSYHENVVKIKVYCSENHHSLKNPPDHVLFVFNIFFGRYKKKMSQKELAQKSHVSIVVIQKICQFDYNPRQSEQIALTKALDVRLANLYRTVDLHKM